MLVIIRSDVNKTPKFKPGDKLVSANVMGQYPIIEYLINRPVKHYIIKCIFTDCHKFINLKKKEKEIKFEDISDKAYLFKTYDEVKEFIATCRENEFNIGTPDILEVVD